MTTFRLFKTRDKLSKVSIALGEQIYSYSANPVKNSNHLISPQRLPRERVDLICLTTKKRTSNDDRAT